MIQQQKLNFEDIICPRCFFLCLGKIAKAGDDSMVVETPVASIGIRGTTVAGRAAQEGEQNTIALLRDSDGGVGQITISNSAGVQTLTQPGQAVTLTSFTQPPPPPVIIPVQQIQQQFGTAIQTRPQQRTNEEQRREEQRQEQQNTETNTTAPEGEGEARPRVRVRPRRRVRVRPRPRVRVRPRLRVRPAGGRG